MLGAFQLPNLIRVQVLEMTWHGVSLCITAMGNNKELKKQNRSIELTIKEPFKLKHREKNAIPSQSNVSTQGQMERDISADLPLTSYC